MPIDLPVLADRRLERYATPKHGMTTRLDERKADIHDEKADERAWRKGVIKADGKICRCCGRKVVPQLALAPERLEVHHVTGRADQAVRWDVRNGLVLCCECHEKVTHHKLVILQVAKFLFRIGKQTYINARKAVTFKAAA